MLAEPSYLPAFSTFCAARAPPPQMKAPGQPLSHHSLAATISCYFQ